MDVENESVDFKKQYVVKVDIDDVIYSIVSHGKKPYEPLLFALLERMTAEQVEKYTIKTVINDNTLLFYDIVNSFAWLHNGDNAETETTYDYCICGHPIVYNYRITNNDDGFVHIVGSTCITTHLLNFLKNSDRINFINHLKRLKTKNDTKETKRCVFCNKNTTNRSCNKCKMRTLVQKMVDIWKIKLKRHKCYYCGIMCDNTFPYCVTCKYYLDNNKHKCYNCNEWCKRPYKLCFTCNSKNNDKKHKCGRCGRLCDKKYEFCYSCKFEPSESEDDE